MSPLWKGLIYILLLYIFYIVDDPSSRLPSVLNDNWLQSLPLVSISVDSVHYQQNELQHSIKTLQTHIDRDEHIDEYKVDVIAKF